MRSLLDVNVLIAALDAGHVHHARVMGWLAAEGRHGWASSPLTQNGCVRIMSQAAYPAALKPMEVIERLREATDHPSHQFWPDDVSLLDIDSVLGERILGPRQLTDLYLLALSVRHGGRLVTMDARIALDAVPGARPDHLLAL